MHILGTEMAIINYIPKWLSFNTIPRVGKL